MLNIPPGTKFEYLTVIIEIARVCYGKTSHRRFLLLCECGKTTRQLLCSLRSGSVVSCGCKRNERNRTSNLRHGLSSHRIMRIWNNMIARCFRPSCRSFKHYGGRGICVCKRWRTFQSFADDMGLPPDGFVIDRKNPDKNYCKSNCQWSPAEDCSSGTRLAIKRRVRFGRKKVSIARLAKSQHVPYSTLYHRIRVQKMSPKEAIAK